MLMLLPSVFAVLVNHLHLRVTECPHEVLRVERESPHRAGPGPWGPFVCYNGYHVRIQNFKVDLGDGLLEAVFCGNAVVQSLVRILNGAD